MDPTTAHQQPRPGSELALNSNSAGQTISVANGHGDSDERIPVASDDGASGGSYDDAAVDDGVAQSPLSRESDEDTRAQNSWMDLGMFFSPADAGAGHPILMHGRVLSYEPCKSPPCRRQRFRTALTSLEAPTTRRTRHGWIMQGQERHETSQDSGASPCSAELFPDQEYNDWHLTSIDPLPAFREQREDADPDADLKILAARRGPALDPGDGSQPEQLLCRPPAAGLALSG